MGTVALSLHGAKHKPSAAVAPSPTGCRGSFNPSFRQPGRPVESAQHGLPLYTQRYPQEAAEMSGFAQRSIEQRMQRGEARILASLLRLWRLARRRATATRNRRCRDPAELVLAGTHRPAPGRSARRCRLTGASLCRPPPRSRPRTVTPERLATPVIQETSYPTCLWFAVRSRTRLAA